MARASSLAVHGLRAGAGSHETPWMVPRATGTKVRGPAVSMPPAGRMPRSMRFARGSVGERPAVEMPGTVEEPDGIVADRRAARPPASSSLIDQSRRPSRPRASTPPPRVEDEAAAADRHRCADRRGLERPGADRAEVAGGEGASLLSAVTTITASPVEAGSATIPLSSVVSASTFRRGTGSGFSPSRRTRPAVVGQDRRPTPSSRAGASQLPAPVAVEHGDQGLGLRSGRDRVDEVGPAVDAGDQQVPAPGQRHRAAASRAGRASCQASGLAGFADPDGVGARPGTITVASAPSPSRVEHAARRGSRARPGGEGERHEAAAGRAAPVTATASCPSGRWSAAPRRRATARAGSARRRRGPSARPRPRSCGSRPKSEIPSGLRILERRDDVAARRLERRDRGPGLAHRATSA